MINMGYADSSRKILYLSLIVFWKCARRTRELMKYNGDTVRGWR
jgi:hypothetical protein